MWWFRSVVSVAQWFRAHLKARRSRSPPEANSYIVILTAIASVRDSLGANTSHDHGMDCTWQEHFMQHEMMQSMLNLKYLCTERVIDTSSMESYACHRVSSNIACAHTHKVVQEKFFQWNRTVYKLCNSRRHTVSQAECTHTHTHTRELYSWNKQLNIIRLKWPKYKKFSIKNFSYNILKKNFRS